MSFDERGGAPVRRPSTEGRRIGATAPDGPVARDPRVRPARPGLRTVILGAILPVGLLTIWWTLSATGTVPSYLLPSPPQVAAAAVELHQQGLLSTYVLISIQRVLIGFAIGASIGLALGAVVGLSKTASDLLSPLLGALRAVPSLAWLPLLILLLGIFETPKITLIAIGAVFPVFTVVSGALRHVDPHLVEVGRAFGLSRISLLTTVQLPAVVPAVVAGLRLALVQSWLFLVAAELAGSSMGLGFLLSDSQNNGRMDRLFLAIILLGTLGKLTDAIVGIGERALLKRWG